MSAFLLEQINCARYAERKRLADELHDDVSQQVVALKIHAKMLSKCSLEESRTELIENISDSLDKLSVSLRGLAEGLCARLPDNLLLDSAVDQLLQQMFRISGLPVLFNVTGDFSLVQQGVQVTVYRIIQEALNNIVRHSACCNIILNLSFTQQGLTVLIEDDGVGFADVSQNPARNSFGLANMRQRAATLAADFRISSEVGVGTKIFLFIDYGGCVSMPVEALV